MSRINEILQYGGNVVFKDEKGKSFTIERVALGNRGREGLGQQMPKKLRDLIRKRIESPWKKPYFWACMFVFGLFNFGMSFLGTQFGWSWPALLMVATITGPFVIFGMLWIFRFWIRRNFQIVIEVMLQHLVCPACGYSLQQLPADPDDTCTVCPECGGAWKLS